MGDGDEQESARRCMHTYKHARTSTRADGVGRGRARRGARGAGRQALPPSLTWSIYAEQALWLSCVTKLGVGCVVCEEGAAMLEMSVEGAWWFIGARPPAQSSSLRQQCSKAKRRLAGSG